ncbi:ornithine cyclodeaminase family protein [Enterococcus sp. MMGLQ5-2]|nr:ornithine cyclodeaminase family protein [Enterococcus sp. MMGLQ5-2]MBS7584416.1 ornithine cyclodeaminase family protein [Enterococcus sp. MMGLQ5-1]NPD12271.1 ornithine cyclodeaminase family protein [Enterococcus sp. MMGLQ5-1]NPD36971.1 ornithine cyclodeaminase family protein [Enterococcus sp. MMGLQ5-2]
MKHEGKLLFLNEKTVKKYLTRTIVLDLVEQAFSEYAEGFVVNPVKLSLPMNPTYEGYINSMPAYLTRFGVAGMKSVSVFKDNMKDYQLPVTVGSIILNDPETGIPYSFMDGTHITALRTGASVAVMAKYLAAKGAEVVTIIGSGAQGLSSFVMIKSVLPKIKEVRVVDINPEAQERFIEEASAVFPDVDYIKLSDIQSASTGSNIIVGAATSKVPLLANIDYDDGTTVLCIEEDITNRFAGKFDHTIVDFTECFIERTNILGNEHAKETGDAYEEITEETITGEIGDIIINKISGRINEKDKILASPVGMGATDIIVADYVYKKALEASDGMVLDFLDS